MEDSSHALVETMADWSPWVPFAVGAATAPRLPGVYMARQGPDGPIVYVGRAGERAGSGKPEGLWGRLGVYASGKGMVSGLGEAASDRALADPDWLRERLAEVEAGEPMRAIEWGKAAIVRAGLYVRWTTTTTAAGAKVLEKQILDELAGARLWNRERRVVVVRLADLPPAP